MEKVTGASFLIELKMLTPEHVSYCRPDASNTSPYGKGQKNGFGLTSVGEATLFHQTRPSVDVFGAAQGLKFALTKCGRDTTGTPAIYTPA
jgi:hypothetical protein